MPTTTASAPKAATRTTFKKVGAVNVSPCQWFKQQAARAVDLARQKGGKVRVEGEGYVFWATPMTDPRKLTERISKKELRKPCKCSKH